MKLSVVNTRFVVNEEKRTVACICDCRFKYIVFGSYKNEPFSVTAVAKCHTNDKFDEELGKKIARAKAENKAYQICALECKLYKKHLNRALKNFTEFKEKANKCIEHNKGYIERISE